jgi:hypothetical protein
MHRGLLDCFCTRRSMLLTGRRREFPWLEVLAVDLADRCRRRTHQSGPLGELFDHGVDALNTSLECLIFAASQNLGMGWKTVLTLFGCMLLFTDPGRVLIVCSALDILRSNLGRIPHENPHTWSNLRPRRRNRDSNWSVRIHSIQGGSKFLATIAARDSRCSKIRLDSGICLQPRVQ